MSESPATTPPATTKRARSSPGFGVQVVRSIGPGCLAGIRCGDWWRLLASNGFQVAPRYWGKAAHLTLTSLVTTPLAWLEQYLWGPLLESTVVEPPLFVLGSWRSGTTYLHNLLTQDDRYCSPDLYQTMYPLTYHLSRSWWGRFMQACLPKKRFMDNVAQSLDEPAEDEMAIAVLCQKSNMLSWALSHREEYYERFLSFEQATSRDRDQFREALEFFVRKVQQESGLPLILKSPNHTARIRLLLETFPEAKFVHIHRHPYDVYRSFMHMTTQVIPVWSLQKYNFEHVEEMVIRLYRELYRAYFSQKELIPPGHLHELSYEDLAQAPAQEIERIYASLGLPDFERMRPRLQAYLDQTQGYRRNKHHEIAPETREKLHREWGFCFDAWGYEKDESGLSTPGTSG